MSQAACPLRNSDTKLRSNSPPPSHHFLLHSRNLPRSSLLSSQIAPQEHSALQPERQAHPPAQPAPKAPTLTHQSLPPAPPAPPVASTPTTRLPQASTTPSPPAPSAPLERSTTTLPPTLHFTLPAKLAPLERRMTRTTQVTQTTTRLATVNLAAQAVTVTMMTAQQCA